MLYGCLYSSSWLRFPYTYFTLEAGYAALSSDGGVNWYLFCSVALLCIFFASGL